MSTILHTQFNHHTLPVTPFKPVPIFRVCTTTAGSWWLNNECRLSKKKKRRRLSTGFSIQQQEQILRRCPKQLSFFFLQNWAEHDGRCMTMTKNKTEEQEMSMMEDAWPRRKLENKKHQWWKMHDQEENRRTKNVHDGRSMTKKKTGEQEMSTII